MSLSHRERRMVMLLAPAVLIIVVLRFTVLNDSAPSAPAATADADSIALAQQRADRLRHMKALVPAREAVMKQTASDVAARERGLIPGDTAAQAQAALLGVARRVGKNDQLDIRGGDFPSPKALADYALVYTTINFECHVDQLVNFLADLGRQPELIVPSDEHIVAGQDRKLKIVVVRMVLAGVVPKKLIPEKKGLDAF